MAFQSRLLIMSLLLLSTTSFSQNWLELSVDNVGGKELSLNSNNPPNNGVQIDVRSGGNDFLTFYVKTLTGSPDWTKMEVALTVRYQTRSVIVGNYISGTPGDWRQVNIPLDDFMHDPSRWNNGMSSFKLRTIAGVGAFTFGLDEVLITGSGTPYTWYGDADETFGGIGYLQDSSPEFQLLGRRTGGGFSSGGSAPNVPTGFSATASGTDQIGLNWNDLADETSYEIRWSTMPGQTNAPTLTAAQNATAFSHTGLTPGTTYYYQLRALNSNGASAYTSEISALTTPVSGGGDNLGDHIATQSIVPDVDGAYDLGSSAEGFNDVHIMGEIFLNKTRFIGGANIRSVAIGENSLTMSQGDLNVAIGRNSLRDNSEGRLNVAIGSGSMRNNTTGTQNVAIGQNALEDNQDGDRNMAIGALSLTHNISGQGNVGIGERSMFNNEQGNNNTGIGQEALRNNRFGNFNTAIGYNSGPAGLSLGFDNTTAIGSNTLISASNQVRIGDTNVTDIGGQVSWSTLSDGRFKRRVKEDVSGLAFIQNLRPVSYEVNKQALRAHLGVTQDEQAEAQNARTAQPSNREIGFIAQEVEQAMKETGFMFNGVHVPENEYDHYTIRYAEFVVPLVKAVQELSQKVESQQAVIEELKGRVAHEEASTLTQKIELFQNRPNPFSQDTKIEMSLPESVKNAQLIVYNLEGKQLKSVNVETRGNTEIVIGSNELDAGMYIYALIVDGEVAASKRMILTK